MIRDFAPDDQPVVRQLVLAGLRERWGDAFDPGVNPDLDDIADTYIGAGAEVVVVDERDEIVATGILMPEPGGRGRILRMSVSRSHRRTGHGRRVVEELVDQARRWDAGHPKHLPAGVGLVGVSRLGGSCGEAHALVGQPHEPLQAQHPLEGLRPETHVVEHHPS